jgi:WXG100 family type VII secretion target
MVQKVRADYELLAEIAQTFEHESRRTRQTLDRLHQDLDVLLEGDWVGKAATAFYQEMIASVLPSLKRLADALEQGGRAARQMSRIMKQAEDDSAALFRLSDRGGPGDGKGAARAKEGASQVSQGGSADPVPNPDITPTATAEEQSDTVELNPLGERMDALFRLYQETPGWWNGWDTSSGRPTLQEFIGLMLIYEASEELDFEVFDEQGNVTERTINTVFQAAFMEAAGRWIWMSIPGAPGRPFCQGEVCHNGALNLFGEGIQSARGQLRYVDSGSLPADVSSLPVFGEHLYNDYIRQGYSEEEALGLAGEAVMERANILGDVINPATAAAGDWTTWDPDRPYTWGNGPTPADDPLPDWNPVNRSDFNELSTEIADAIERGEQPEVNGDDAAWYARGYWDESTRGTYNLFAIFSFYQYRNMTAPPPPPATPTPSPTPGA